MHSANWWSWVAGEIDGAPVLFINKAHFGKCGLDKLLSSDVELLWITGGLWNYEKKKTSISIIQIKKLSGNLRHTGTTLSGMNSPSLFSDVIDPRWPLTSVSSMVPGGGEYLPFGPVGDLGKYDKKICNLATEQ